MFTLSDVAVHFIDVIPVGHQDFYSVSEGLEHIFWVFLLVILFGYLEMLPSLEAFSAQETYDAGIPSFLGDIGRFQCEGDVTLPLLKCCLLVL